MILEYHKIADTVQTPTRSNPSDAGLDVYAHLSDESITLRAGENKLIPTGLKFGIPHGYMLQVCNRSSMGAKRSLVVGAHIIDSGYSGEVFIDLHNIGLSQQKVLFGDKIAQLVLVPVVPMRLRHRDDENLYDNEGICISNREEGNLGSTDSPQTENKTSLANLQMRDRNIGRLVGEGWTPNGF